MRQRSQAIFSPEQSSFTKACAALPPLAYLSSIHFGKRAEEGEETDADGNYNKDASELVESALADHSVNALGPVSPSGGSAELDDTNAFTCSGCKMAKRRDGIPSLESARGFVTRVYGI